MLHCKDITNHTQKGLVPNSLDRSHCTWPWIPGITPSAVCSYCCLLKPSTLGYSIFYLVYNVKFLRKRKNKETQTFIVFNLGQNMLEFYIDRGMHHKNMHTFIYLNKVNVSNKTSQKLRQFSVKQVTWILCESAWFQVIFL